MFDKRNINISPWILLVVALSPQTSLCESFLGRLSESIMQMSRNTANLVTGGLNFFAEDIRSFIFDELDDMTPREEQAFDFIVVGAGSAGAAIASRLSEVANISVLLIEAGIAENEIMDIPLLAPYLELDKRINWDYSFESSSVYCLANRNHQCKLPRGKVMGGSSVLNFMIATRGSYENYDNWAKHGCEGWSWKDVFPIFKKLENFEVQGDEIDMQYHGTGGPLNIARAPYHTGASHTFLEASKERGFPKVDYNGKEMIGYSLLESTVRNGMRFSSNHAYLYPAKNRSNLFLTKYSQASKILIDPTTKEAYGVEMYKFGRKIRVLANKEVIVSGGAVNSPQLLMLSGIGPAAHLQEMGIDVLKDSPVGENLMEHVFYYGLNILVNESITIVTKDLYPVISNALPQFFDKRDGPFTSTGSSEAVAFMNTGDLSFREGSPDMEFLMTGSSVGSDRFAYIVQNIAYPVYEKYFRPLLDRPSFMILPTLQNPKSRGKILLASNNYKDYPRIIPNFFDHPDDMKVLILGIREALKIIQTEALQKYDARLPDYPVPGCEKLNPNSDKYWDCAARTFTNTMWHPSGTCKMGAKNDNTAVVDPRLKVIGIGRLRVADASVIPIIPAGHTNVPTIMIAEKLAQMMKEDHKLIS